MLHSSKSNEIIYSSTKSNLYQIKFCHKELKYDFVGRVFELPYEMTENEMYIILSYTLDYIKNLLEIDVKAFITLDILLEKIGFFAQEYTENDDINIITIKPDFEKSKWYKKNTTINQINSIYRRINYIYNVTEKDIIPNKKTLKK